ncbi:hypothetical protein [Yoonia sp. 208BN28-4]|uniref:hypothetical protein n=1 Tax=Yoonia sp. 208BN28-4 TaxID=3126505 RepID=UPI00309EACA9
MTRFVSALALIAVAACGEVSLVSDTPSAPATVQLSAKERFIRAVEGQGCVLSADNVGAILSRASITPDDMRRIVPELEAAGQAEVASDGEIRVLSANCI